MAPSPGTWPDGSIAYIRFPNSSSTAGLYHRATGHWYPILAASSTTDTLEQRTHTFDDTDFGPKYTIITPDGDIRLGTGAGQITPGDATTTTMTTQPPTVIVPNANMTNTTAYTTQQITLP